MATSKIYTAQKALNTCPDHEHVEMEMYCRTCKKPVCTRCVKGDHHGHDWDTLIAIAKELRKQSTHQKLLTESVSKSILIGTEEFLNSLAEVTDNELEFNYSALEKKRKSIVDFVNKLIDEMKSKCKESHKSKMKPIDERRKCLENKGKRINFLIQNMEVGARDYTDYDLIELFDEINQILDELQALSVFTTDKRERMIYRPGTLDKASLKSLVGFVEVDKSPPEVVIEKELTIGETDIGCINLISETEAWVRSDRMNKLVDMHGNIKQSVDTKCLLYNFVVSQEGLMYFCNRDSKHVQVIDTQGNIRSLFSTSPLLPLYINLTRSGDLLITLADEDSHSRNTSSRRLVRRTTMTGEVMKEYEDDNDGKTPLFSKPLRVVEQFNGNICVINEYKEGSDDLSGTVYGLHFRNNVIFRYDGSNDDFNPIDICCDNESNTLISYELRKVHIIDSKGIFVRFLLTESSFNENLWAISLFGRKVWIGSRESGLVKVFKFKQ